MLKTKLSVNHFVLESRFSEFTLETRFFGKHFIFATRLGVKQLICIREKTLNSAFLFQTRSFVKKNCVSDKPFSETFWVVF